MIIEDVEILERILHTLPVKVCAGCRVVYDPDEVVEWHRSGCIYLKNGQLTEVIGYRSLFEAQEAGVIYTPPTPLIHLEAVGAA